MEAKSQQFERRREATKSCGRLGTGFSPSRLEVMHRAMLQWHPKVASDLFKNVESDTGS